MIFAEISNIEECLNEIGCSDDECSDILKCFENKNYQKIIHLLRSRRQQILNKIHNEERQISSLDYLIFQIEKIIKTQV